MVSSVSGERRIQKAQIVVGVVVGGNSWGLMRASKPPRQLRIDTATGFSRLIPSIYVEAPKSQLIEVVRLFASQKPSLWYDSP